jgi:hypothetical protein
MSSTGLKIALAAGAVLMSTALAVAQPGETVSDPGAVALAENAWDFNDPSGVPGFGPMRPGDDMAALLAQALGRPASPSPVTQAAR